MTLLFGLAALAVLLWMAQKYLQADPRKLAAVLKLSGGIAALAFAAFFAVRGQLAVAVPLGMTGLGLLGWLPFGPAGFGARTQKSAGQVSRVRSAFLEMELDHDTGAMRGVILTGPREGTRLEALDVDTLLGLMREIDDESRALLAAYLDRRDAGWREHAEADAASRQGGSAARGPMSQEEAYQILGLEPGAKAEEIIRAHRTLMKRIHPDQGGTNYLAARVNEAKDTLLRQHR
jgi:DnaJ domain